MPGPGIFEISAFDRWYSAMEENCSQFFDSKTPHKLMIANPTSHDAQHAVAAFHERSWSLQIFGSQIGNQDSWILKAFKDDDGN